LKEKACKNGRHTGIHSEHERGIAKQTYIRKDPKEYTKPHRTINLGESTFILGSIMPIFNSQYINLQNDSIPSIKCLKVRIRENRINGVLVKAFLESSP